MTPNPNLALGLGLEVISKNIKTAITKQAI
jgi:hypothetical protein